MEIKINETFSTCLKVDLSGSFPFRNGNKWYMEISWVDLFSSFPFIPSIRHKKFSYARINVKPLGGGGGGGGRA